jgi:aminopeptidase-like protein
LTALSKILKSSKYTIKLLLIPETIGAIAYINKNINFLKQNLVTGINLSCVGDKGKFSLISSLKENTYADKVCLRILKNKKFKKYSFLDRGSNERQFGCQNLNLPFVTICRSKFGDYKQYHTSADNLEILTEKNLRESAFLIKEIVNEIQKNKIFLKQTTCEPFLTKYNLVNLIGGPKKIKYFEEVQNIIAYAGKDFDIKELSLKLKINFKKFFRFWWI